MPISFICYRTVYVFIHNIICDYSYQTYHFLFLFFKSTYGGWRNRLKRALSKKKKKKGWETQTCTDITHTSPGFTGRPAGDGGGRARVRIWHHVFRGNGCRHGTRVGRRRVSSTSQCDIPVCYRLRVRIRMHTFTFELQLDGSEKRRRIAQLGIQM